MKYSIKDKYAALLSQLAPRSLNIKTLVIFTFILFIVPTIMSDTVSATTIYSTRDFTDSSDIYSLFSSQKIVCFGDSLTVGSQNVGGNYTHRLNRTFNLYGADTNVINSGLSADYVVHAGTQLTARVNDHSPDYVVMMFGTNDMRAIFGNPGGNPCTSTQFATDYTTAITNITTNNPGVVIYALTIPPIVTYLQGSYYNHTLFNDEIRNLSGVTVIDIWEEMYDTGNVSWVGADNIHLTDTGYKYLSEFVVIEILKTASVGVTADSAGLKWDYTNRTGNTSYYTWDDRLTNIWSGDNITTYNTSGNNYLDRGIDMNGINDKIWGTILCGDQIVVKHAMGPTSGIVDVDIDGVNLGQIDAYAAGVSYNQSAAFEMDGYPQGYYNISLEVTGKNGASTNYTMVFDAVFTNVTNYRGQARSSRFKFNGPLFENTIIEYVAAAPTALRRMVSVYDPEAFNSPYQCIEIYERLHAVPSYQNSYTGMVTDGGNVTFSIYGNGSATLYYPETSQGGWFDVYVNEVWTTGAEMLNPSSIWDGNITFDLGTFGEKDIRIESYTNSTTFYMTGCEYWTQNYVVRISEDNIDYELITANTTKDWTTVYYEIIFYANGTVDSISVTFEGDLLSGTLNSALAAYLPILLVVIFVTLFVGLILSLRRAR